MGDLAERRREAVADVYAAFVSRELEQVGEVFDRTFSPEIVLHEPDQLPYGGAYEGLDTVKEFIGGLVDPQSPVDAAQLVVDDIIASDSTDRVVGYVSFPWHPPGAEGGISMSALELFTFEEMQVVEIRVFLWDTAACIASLQAAADA